MTNYWLLVGSPQNWETAFYHGNIWGLRQSQKRLWENLGEKDIVLFYATNPVGGIIGHGRVRTKMRQNQPLWPQEVIESKVIWPLRFEFDVDYCLPPVQWKTKRIFSRELFPKKGFQSLYPQLAQQLISYLSAVPLGTQPAMLTAGKEQVSPYEPEKEGPETALPTHADVRDALVEIGRLQNFLAESEYPIEIGNLSGKLDVVWRRVQQSVPTYVYEVQIGGNIYQALTKLKHAYDLWNSRVYLVSPQDQLGSARQLLSGSFHEVSDRLKFIDCLSVKELLMRKRNYCELEKRLGILD